MFFANYGIIQEKELKRDDSKHYIYKCYKYWVCWLGYTNLAEQQGPWAQNVL